MAAHHTNYEPQLKTNHAVVAVESKLHMWGWVSWVKRKGTGAVTTCGGVWHHDGAMGTETNPRHPTTWTVGHCIHSGRFMSVCAWGV